MSLIDADVKFHGPWQATKPGIYDADGLCIAMRHPQFTDNARWAKAALAMAAVPDLHAALESTLMFLTNVNSIEPSELAEKVIAALEKAGMDKESADDARTAMANGPCSLQDSGDFVSCEYCDGDGAIETPHGSVDDCEHCAGTGVRQIN